MNSLYSIGDYVTIKEIQYINTDRNKEGLNEIVSYKNVKVKIKQLFTSSNCNTRYLIEFDKHKELISESSIIENEIICIITGTIGVCTL